MTVASVKRTLTTLGLGLLLQRAAQVVVLLLLARSLGEAATGLYAQGIAIAGVLAMLAGAGVRNPVARALAQHPDAARDWLQAAIKLRLLRAVCLVAAAIAIAWATSTQPWFWTLCALAALPMSFDLKHLGDAVATTGREVVFETAANVALAVIVPIWLLCGGQDLAHVAALTLGARLLYALGAWSTTARLPSTGRGPDLRDLRRRCRAVMPAQVAGNLCIDMDVWLVARLCGDATAGLYAVGMRIASAAAMPSAQLARLFFAHQLHAAQRGDLARTTRVALRATSLFLLPVVAGGAVCAEGLCAWFGPGFEAAGWSLRWCLLAIALQHVGWQMHQALLSLDRDRAFSRALWQLAAVHVGALVTLALSLGATGAALAAALAQATFAASAAAALGRSFALPWRWLRGPILLALGTAGAASGGGWLAAAWLGAPWTIAGQLGCGGLAWALGIHASEMRHRWHRIGSGLSQASGMS